MSLDLIGENRENSLQLYALPHTVKTSSASEQLARAALTHSQKVNKDSTTPAWDHIRQLDECENWVERTQVVTKSDHQFHLSCAQDFLEEMINTFPEVENWQEITSDAQLVQDDFQDEDFQTTAAQFDIDYLERLKSNNSDEAIALSRQSLYVKFDPLVGAAQTARPSPAAKARQLEQLNANYFTDKPNDLLQLDTPPRNNTNSGDRSQRKAVHFTPGGAAAKPRNLMEHDLLTASPNNSLVNYDEGLPGATGSLMPGASETMASQPPSTDVPETEELVKVLKYSDADVAMMIEHAQAEAARREQETRAVLVQEHSQEVAQLKETIAHLKRENDTVQSEAMLQFADKTIWEHNVESWKNSSKKFDNDNSMVLESYEKVKASIMETEKQREQATMDFESLEKSFNEIHLRYMKLKNVAQALRKNEALYKETNAGLKAKQDLAEKAMKKLQLEVDSRISDANQTFNQMKKDHASDSAILKMNCKKLTMQKDSLEKALKQKEQEKSELTAICDELMKELGDKG